MIYNIIIDPNNKNLINLPLYNNIIQFLSNKMYITSNLYPLLTLERLFNHRNNFDHQII